MPMRTDCRHYESRTYPSGDTMRKCRLDLAPEAPWRCPADCPRYERRMVDVGWQYGSLREAVMDQPAEPPVLGDDVARLLDEAEEIVNIAGRDIVSEIEAKGRRRFPGFTGRRTANARGAGKGKGKRKRR
jgi:hypothetical protein